MSRDILLSHIDADPEQPRKHFDQAALDELAQSMDANGLAVPILVRPVGERFMLVHGERRWRAATQLGWETIPAEVRDLSAEEAHWLALIENVQRADLSPIEEARAYQAYLATGVTQEELGRRIGKSRTHIATMLRFLRLPEDMQEDLAAGVISEGHAKQLLRIDNSALRYAVYWGICRDRMTVAQTSKIIDSALSSPEHAEVLIGLCSERNLVELEASLSRNLEKFRESNIAMGKILRLVHAKLPAEQFDRWAQAQWSMDRETAKDFMTFPDNPTNDNITDRMFDHFFKWIEENVSRDTFSLPSHFR